MNPEQRKAITEEKLGELTSQETLPENGSKEMADLLDQLSSTANLQALASEMKQAMLEGTMGITTALPKPLLDQMNKVPEKTAEGEINA